MRWLKWGSRAFISSCLACSAWQPTLNAAEGGGGGSLEAGLPKWELNKKIADRNNHDCYITPPAPN